MEEQSGFDIYTTTSSAYYPDHVLDPLPPPLKQNNDEDGIITVVFVGIYVLLVCAILIGITLGIIYYIRQRRRELINREQL